MMSVGLKNAFRGGELRTLDRSTGVPSVQAVGWSRWFEIQAEDGVGLAWANLFPVTAFRFPVKRQKIPCYPARENSENNRKIR